MKLEDLYKQIDGLPTASGIYRIYNQETGDSYIGASKNIRMRCFQHFSRLSNGQSSKSLNLASFVGGDKFAVEALKLCPESELWDEEARYIEEQKPTLNSRPQQKTTRVSSDGLLTVNEAAEIKGVSRQAIHAAIQRNDLVAIEVMVPSKRIAPEALKAFKPNPNMKRCGPKSTKRKKPR